MPATNKTSRQRQSGAAAIMGVLMLTLLVLFAVLALDSGRLWMQQRQLQSATDIAAIEAARRITGCGNVSTSDLVAAAQEAAAANGFTGSVSSSPNSVVLGSTSGGVRSFTAGGAQAVQVVLTRDVPASIVAGGLFNRRITLQTEAVSVANTSFAQFTVGTTTLSLNTSDSALLNGLLSGVLGSNINLDLVSYRGLADTNIKLLDLIRADGSIGNVNDLLALNTTVGDFLNLVSHAADQQSGQAALIASEAVQDLLSGVNRDLALNVGDILSITHPDPNALVDASINLLSLITTTAFVANGQNAISLPLGINIGPLLGVNASVRVIEPSKMVIGPPAGPNGVACTTVSTAQVRVDADAFVIGVLDLKLKLDVAPGTASLREINRINGGRSTEVLVDAQPGIATLSLRNTADTGPATVLLGLATVSLNLPITNPPATMTFEVDNPSRANLPQMQSSNTPLANGLANALGQPDAIVVRLLGLDLLGLVGGLVNTLVRPLLVAIATTLLDPLLKLLGIQVGVIDVKLEEVKISQPQPLII